LEANERRSGLALLTRSPFRKGIAFRFDAFTIPWRGSKQQAASATRTLGWALQFRQLPGAHLELFEV
jgi:hypothetical protein